MGDRCRLNALAEEVEVGLQLTWSGSGLSGLPGTLDYTTNGTTFFSLKDLYSLPDFDLGDGIIVLDPTTYLTQFNRAYRLVYRVEKTNPAGAGNIVHTQVSGISAYTPCAAA